MSARKTSISRRLGKSGAKTAAGSLLRRRAAMTVNPAAAGPGWRALSEHYTNLAETRSGRDDLNVVVAPRATAFTKDEREGRSKPAPGYYMPSAARIALDGTMLPVPPEKLDTDEPDHFKALAAMQGVFEHEVGHAMHTDSVNDAFNTKGLGEAVRVLEEIRMEARHIDHRPEAAKWLRASCQRLIMAEVEEATNKQQAAHQAILTEGRVAAGSMKIEDVEQISDVLEEIFEDDELGELRSIMADTVEIEDGDNDALRAVAQRLVELLPADGAGGEGIGSAGSALGEAIAKGAGGAEADAAEDLESSPEGGEAEEATESVQDDDEVKKMDEDDDLDPDAPEASPPTKAHGRGGTGRGVRWTDRPAEPQERVERKRMAEKFKKARWRDREKVMVSSTVPPGRLRSREAVRGAAERALGRPSTAKPFRKPKRRQIEQPKMRVGILCDASGSMGPYVDQLAQSMWILSGAVYDAEGKMTGIAFGEEARVVVDPGKPSPTVQRFPADGGYESIGSAVQLADELLGLAEPHGPRMLVIVSDGHWVDHHECELGDMEIARLQATGVKVVQVGIGHAPRLHGADEAVTITEASELAELVGNACLDALRSA